MRLTGNAFKNRGKEKALLGLFAESWANCPMQTVHLIEEEVRSIKLFNKFSAEFIALFVLNRSACFKQNTFTFEILPFQTIQDSVVSLHI